MLPHDALFFKVVDVHHRDVQVRGIVCIGVLVVHVVLNSHH
jgi:hypothetical protein